MNYLELMRTRYTTKAYDATARLDEAQIDELLEILRLSPSSINSQPWAFRLVSSPEEKELLAQHAAFNDEKIRKASHLIVLCVYKDAATFATERLPHMDERVTAYYKTALEPHGEQVITSWLERQVYIALGTLLTAAASMGIDSTPMEGIDPKAYTEILGLDKYRALVAVALGKRSADDPNDPSRTPKSRRDDVILR